MTATATQRTTSSTHKLREAAGRAGQGTRATHDWQQRAELSTDAPWRDTFQPAQHACCRANPGICTQHGARRRPHSCTRVRNWPVFHPQMHALPRWFSPALLCSLQCPAPSPRSQPIRRSHLRGAWVPAGVESQSVCLAINANACKPGCPCRNEEGKRSSVCGCGWEGVVLGGRGGAIRWDIWRR